MEEDWLPSDEEDVDQEELEVALYSQIHFDPITDNVAATAIVKDFHDLNFVQPSFQVGVRNYVAKKFKKLKKAQTKQPTISNLDFISFSSDDKNSKDKDIVDVCQLEERGEELAASNSDKDNGSLQTSSKQDAPIATLSRIIQLSENEDESNNWIQCGDDDDILIAAAEEFDESIVSVSSCDGENKSSVKEVKGKGSKSDQLFEGSSSLNKKNSNKDQEGSVVIDQVLDVDESSSDDSASVLLPFTITKSKKNIQKTSSSAKDHFLDDEQQSGRVNSSLHSESSSESDDGDDRNLLSFCITKAPKSVVKSPPPISEEKTKIETKASNAGKKVKKSVPDQSKGASKAKLEDFIKLISSPPKPKKKAKLKTALRKKRPPNISSRPSTVVVKYHQDTDSCDSDSDSRDSGESNQSAAMKSSKKVDCSGTSTTNKSGSINLLAGDAPDSSDDEVLIIKDKPNSGSNTEKSILEVSSESESGEEKLHRNDSKEKEEESSSGSSSCSDEDDEEMDSGLVNQLGLDFNLRGGLEALLKTPKHKEDSDKRWAIDEKDRLGSRAIQNRYFNPKTVKCRNCEKEGHLAVACPEEKKIVCTLCGIQGHHLSKCPNAICYNCSCPGHKAVECTEPRQNRYRKCARCWMQGHSEKACPDLWRQYHLTIGLDSKKIVKSKDENKSKIYCFNCGRAGHLGYECYCERMNRYIAPYYPFVAEYDRMKNKSKEMTHKKDQHKEKKVLKRKVSKRKMNEADMLTVNNLCIEINQDAAPSAKAKVSKKKSSTSKNKKKRDQKTRDDAETFVSGNTQFQFQEPTKSKYSSHDNAGSFSYGGTSDRFQQPVNVDSIDHSVQFEHKHSTSRHSRRDANHDSSKNEMKSGRHKSKKTKQKEKKKKKPGDDDDEMIDLMNHQVSQNEWWKEEGELDDDYIVLDEYEASEASAAKKRTSKKRQHHSSSSPSTSCRNSSRNSLPKKVKTDSHHTSSYEQHSHHHHQPYHPHPHPRNQHWEHHPHEQEENFISLTSRHPQNISNKPNRPYQHPKESRQKWKPKQGRIVGNNGFKARDWILHNY